MTIPRIDRLGSDQKHLLQTASVIGKEFSGAILVAVAAADDHAKLSTAVLASSLDVLRDAEFILETALYPEVEYAFKHPLTQEVAYRSQLGERRAHLHAAVARTIEQMDADKLDARAALLAYHWEQAGEAFIAAKWYARAATGAGLDSPADALRHWEKVRALLAPVTQSEESVALRLRAASELLIYAFRQGMSSDRVDEIFAEGKALAQTRGDVREQVRLLYGVGVHYFNLAQHRRVISFCEESLALADASGDRELRWTARELLEFAFAAVGDLDRALRMNDQQVEFSRADPAIGLAMVGISTSSSFWHRGTFLKDLGRFDEAIDAFRRCEEIARRFNESEVPSWNDFSRSLLFDRMGDVQAALSAGWRAIEIAEKIGSVLSRVGSHGSYGIALGLAGDWEASRKSLELALEISREHRVAFFLHPDYLAALAEAYLGLGDAPRARELANEAIQTADEMEMPVAEVHASLALARILIAVDGVSAQAEIASMLDRATLLVRSTGAVSYGPQILVERARLAELSGDSAGRTDLIREAHRLFIAMGATGRAERVAREQS